MKITLLAAMAENRVIGLGGSLPWRLPEDLKRFKRRTDGHVIIMGRRTFESLNGPLPNRRTIVITRRRDYEAPGAVRAHSLDEALDTARAWGEQEVFIVGGAAIYAAALPLADSSSRSGHRKDFRCLFETDEVIELSCCGEPSV